MEIELRLFASFRDIVGEKEIEREYDGSPDVGTVLQDLVTEYPDLEFFDEVGELREYLSILKNGRDITFLEGTDTSLEEGDVLSVFPPVAGG